MPGASPAPMDPTNRVNVPHDMGQNFMQNPQMAQNFNPQHFNPAMLGQMNMAQMSMVQNSMQPNAMNPAQKYQMQLQNQARMMAQQQANAANAVGGQIVQGQPVAQAGQMRNVSPPQEFFRGLQSFSAVKGRPVNLHPLICGRQIDMGKLYLLIMKLNGSNNVSKKNLWPVVAQNVGFPPQAVGQAALELSQYWLANIAAFEQMWLAQRHRMAQQTQTQMQMQNRMSPSRDGQVAQNVLQHQRSQPEMMNMKMNGQLSNTSMMNVNGSPMPKQELDTPPVHQRSSLSRQIDASDLNGVSSDTQRPGSAIVKPEVEPEPTMPTRKPIEDPFVAEALPANKFHGPINVEEMFVLGQHVVEQKPIVPALRELGVIDIHALTMSIKSGMHNETRNALDTLITISSEPSMQLQLEHCDDLMETLIDCAEAEVDFLSEHSSEVSDEISLSSYEELVRLTHAEARSLQQIPEFGSLEYDLDRAADRLICITTLIRNFSFYEPNFAILGQLEVIHFLTRLIQYIGRKDLPLRSHRNTLDFTKDLVIYLSNLSYTLSIPDKQSALCLLHFLLSFAPQPVPSSSSTAEKNISFTPYSPSCNKYLPPALDAFAKLLARDDPNKTYFKAIFLSPTQASANVYDLLTRAFALAIAPIPSPSSTPQQHLRSQIEARKPFLLQGLLAAEVLASVAPGNEMSLACSWLRSEDCWAGSLLKIASILSVSPQSQRQNRMIPGRNSIDDDPLAYASIVARSVAVLRILVAKARVAPGDLPSLSSVTIDREDSNSAATDPAIPTHALPRKEHILNAILQKDADPFILRLFCEYGVVDD